MRTLNQQECQQVSAAAIFPYENEDGDIVVSKGIALGAIGGMIGGALNEWAGLFTGFVLGILTLPIFNEITQGFPHFQKK